MDGDIEVPIKIRHDEKTHLTKIQIDDREQIIRGYVSEAYIILSCACEIGKS